MRKRIEDAADQGSHHLSWHGFSGRVKEGVDPDPVLELLGPDPVRGLVKSSRAESVQATYDKGSRVYRAFLDLGQAREELFIKTFDSAQVWRVMAERMLSRKGLVRPFHYPKKFARMLFEPSPAKRSWIAAAACHQAGIPVAEPLLYLSRIRTVYREEVLVTRGVNPRTASQAREYFTKNFPPPNPPARLALKRSLINDLGALLRKVRESGIMFPDFKIHNLVLEEPAQGGFRFVVIDLSEAVVDRHYPEFVLLERFIRSFRRSPNFTTADSIRLVRAYLATGHDPRPLPEVCEGIRQRARKQGR